ncbi:MAG: site-specific DNA-methyltransferase [Bacilli bacterium]|nr:site-specific DNA-methyltransferase [Bacilli bacterium]
MKFEDMTKEELIDYINNLSEDESGKFGLRWDKEKNPEQIVVDCDKYLPILTEDNSFSIDMGGIDNILIEGDNFHALTALNYTHETSVDMIYIDPPYNTGHEDFKYNDKYVEIEDGYRHSKWLNFMEKRLKLAKNLLKDDGIICISIDDNELYQLKLLCDKWFDESNFIANLVIETANGVFGTRASQTKKTFVKVKDYVLVYAKNKNSIERDFQPLYMSTKEPFDTHYSIMLDDNLNRISFVEFLRNDKKISKIFKKYDLKISMDNISKLMQIDSEFNRIIIEDLSKKVYQDVSFSLNLPEDVEKRISLGETVRYNNYIVFKTRDGQGTVRQYISFYDSLNSTDEYISEYKKTVAIGDLWKNFDFDMKNVSKEGGVDFKNGKKPVRLIRQLIKWNNVKDAVVLDFFAGSGTTGQAVIEQNMQDGGTRKFILCTNNENNICEEVTYPRLKNVISDGESLRYYKTEFIENSNNRDQLYFDLTEKCIPMLCIKESTFVEYKITSEYMIYRNQDSTNYTCVYYDLFGNCYDEFITELEHIKEDKSLYIFSLDQYVYDDSLNRIKNYKIEAIPYKIIELYRKLVKISKED